MSEEKKPGADRRRGAPQMLAQHQAMIDLAERSMGLQPHLQASLALDVAHAQIRFNGMLLEDLAELRSEISMLRLAVGRA